VAVKLAKLARIYKVHVSRFMIAFIGLELADRIKVVRRSVVVNKPVSVSWICCLRATNDRIV